MTTKTLYNGRTTAEWEAIVVDYETGLEKAKENVLEAANDVAKAAKAKKIDMDKIRHLNHMLERAFKRLDQAEEHLAEFRKTVETSKRYDAGYGEIQEFLEELLQRDIDWHKMLQITMKGMTTSEMMEAADGNKSLVMLAKMSEEDALKMFKNDLDMRYAKLVKQIESKVGAVKEFKLARNANFGLDGYVEGEKGLARIETIIAGGHNIQREHYRTLVKEVKAVKA